MSIENLHVYGQGSYHQEAYIVGDRAALMRLRHMIDRVLAPGLGMEKEEFFASDGEGYELYVIDLEGNDGWEQIARPYTDEVARDPRKDCIAPYRIVIERRKRTV